jgi:RimJ/RimL family protein N-acetyltransferase
MIFLETERLVLRRLTMGDVDNLVALDSDPDVMRYLADGRPKPRHVIEREKLPRMLGYYERFDGFGFWAAEQRDTGAFVGWFALLPADGGDVELGYRLRRAAWGKGYATEAAGAALRYGFEVVGLDQIIAVTHPDHVASRRVMEKSGMQFAGTARLYGMELVRYVRTRADFEVERAGNPAQP